MKTKCYFIHLLLYFVLCSTIHAQSLTWVKALSGSTGYEGCYTIALDSAGNIYASGSYDNPTDFDPGPGSYVLNCLGFDASFVCKLDASGNLIWARQMAEGAVESRGWASTVDAAGNTYATGDFIGTADLNPGPGTNSHTTGNSSHDVYVTKLDPNGNYVWAKVIGGTSHNAGITIAVDGNGNVLTAGYLQGTADFDPGTGVFSLSSNGSYDIFICKLDASGNFMWAKAIGGTGMDWNNGLFVDVHDNVFLSGSFNATVDFDPGPGADIHTSAGGTDIFLLKLDGSGNYIWAKQMGGTASDGAGALKIQSNGDIYVPGAFQNTVDFDPGTGTYNLTSSGSDDAFVCKLDSTGNFIWAKNFGGGNTNGAMEIALDSSTIYVAGHFENTADFDPGAGIYNLTAAGSNDIFVSTLDTSGNYVSAIRLGGAGMDNAGGLGISQDGSLYLSGYFYATADFDPGPGIYNLTPSAGSDVFVSKFSATPTGIQMISGSVNQIYLYPNPATKEIRFQGFERIIERIEIYNALGETVYTSTESSANTRTLDISKLKPGIYFVRVKANNEYSLSKFVKD